MFRKSISFCLIPVAFLLFGCGSSNSHTQMDHDLQRQNAPAPLDSTQNRYCIAPTDSLFELAQQIDSLQTLLSSRTKNLLTTLKVLRTQDSLEKVAPVDSAGSWDDVDSLFANGGIPQEPVELGPSGKYKTHYVFVVVIDGVRWSESWGDSSHKLIPNQANIMKPKGVFNSTFYNDGWTETTPGHTAITTGVYQKMNNFGKQLPKYSNIFQHWRKKNNLKKTDNFIIASKGKLAVLASTLDSNWRGRFEPKAFCGVEGRGVTSGYWKDGLMVEKAFSILNEHHPQMALITFLGPDYWGHKKHWNNYIEAIEETDEYVNRLLDFFETDSVYKGKTTVFLTNDHGRHLKGHKNGFHSHGDKCDGCKHISLMAFGPDFKKNTEVATRRNLIDITATIEELMGFDMPQSEGDVMIELFSDEYQDALESKY